MATTVQKITLSSSRDIPFNKLVLSQSNVRRVKAGVSVEELAEDIARRGLLQGLSVRPVVDHAGAETGMFEMPRTSTTCFARSVGSPTTCSASFTVSRSARRKRAADSRSAAAGVGAEVGCTLVVALRSWSEVSPVSRSTTSRTSLSVARSTVALVAADSTAVLASGSRPRTSTRPAPAPTR